MNLFDSSKISELLTDSFIIKDFSGSLNKKQFIHRLDSVKKWNCKTKILSVKNMDSIVVTEEEIYNLVDSVLEINPKPIKRRKYYFADGQISKIVIDTTFKLEEYSKSLNAKIVPFIFYIQDQHNISDLNDIYKNIRDYIKEYSSLSQREKKSISTLSYLQGEFNSNNSFYPKVVFKGRKSVVIYMMGFWPFTTSYEVDENYIRIRGDQNGDILLQIKNENTLIGESFAAGTYIKSKK